MPHDEQLNLSDLLVNTENYRFEVTAGQKEAIDQMIADQKEKLYKLAAHIVENGLNPTDRVIVTPSGSQLGKYVVLEGNRRTVALKLLAQPDIIDLEGFGGLKKKFKQLHENLKGQQIKKVACVIFDTAAESNKWIKLKHTGQNDGVGTVEWVTQQIQRFDEKVGGKSTVAMQIVKMLVSSDEVPDAIRGNLQNLKITNLDRLISDPAVRDFLGIEVQGARVQSFVDKQEVLKGLVKVAQDLLDPKFKVNKIYTKEDRANYLKAFSKAHTPDIRKTAAKPWHLGSATATQTMKRSAPRERRALIPKTCALYITNLKVGAIYFELKKIPVEEFKNAVAVLFRVFVELSIDCYREENNLTTQPSSSADGTDLRQKIHQVINHLETLKKADKGICQGVRSGLKNDNGLLGITTWHSYVHNNRFSPISKDLMTTWDNIQAFMELVWAQKP
jgi:hypothetical protein